MFLWCYSTTWLVMCFRPQLNQHCGYQSNQLVCMTLYVWHGVSHTELLGLYIETVVTWL